jgi:hypothetical protein
MRTFEDGNGRRWDVAVAEESYGTQRLIFAERKSAELRSCALDVSSRDAAERMLLELNDSQLRALLAESAEWRPG